jgi:single-strand DNA-binding protein
LKEKIKVSNNISLVGRVGQDAELKTVKEFMVLEFSIANNTGFGEKEVCSWYKCSIWGTRGGKLQEHVTKGKELFISGELSLRKYTNNDGDEKMSPEIKVEQLTFVGGKKEDNNS